MINITHFLKGLAIEPKSVSESTQEGELEVVSGKLLFHDGTGAQEVILDNFTGNLSITGILTVTGQIDVDNLRLDGNSLISTNTNGNVIIDPNGTGSIQLVLASGGLVELGSANATVSDTGIVTITGQLNVDNLRLDGNTISSTDVNGNINLDPNGTGSVNVLAALQVDGTITTNTDTQAITIATKDRAGGSTSSITINPGNVTSGTFSGGSLFLASGQGNDLDSGTVYIYSGYSTGTNYSSGAVVINSGDADNTGKASGVVSLYSGDGYNGAQSGDALIKSGISEVQTGSVNLVTGDASSTGISGNINITSGTATDPNDRGKLVVDTRAMTLPKAAADPAGVLAQGDTYYNTTTDEVKTYDGVTWSTVGSGDVNGPGSSNDGAIALFDGVTGKLLKESSIETGYLLPTTIVPVSESDPIYLATKYNSSGPSGNVFVVSGNPANSGDASGNINLTTGTTDAAASGNILITTGGASGGGNTGGITVATSNSSLGVGGDIQVSTGSSGNATGGGKILVSTGAIQENSSTENNIQLTTGAAGTTSGNINLTTGTGSSAGGDINLTTGGSAFPDEGRIILNAKTLKLPVQTADPAGSLTEGDIYYNSTSDLIRSYDGAVWSDVGAGGGMSNPMTTLGDMITGGVGGTPQRLAVGTNGDILTVVAGEPAWVTPDPSVSLKAALNTGTSFTASNPIIYDTVIFDSASGYNNTTGEYTVPVTGKYLITINTSVDVTAGFYVKVNGTTVDGYLNGVNGFLGCGAALYDLVQNDVVTIITDSTANFNGYSIPLYANTLSIALISSISAGGGGSGDVVGPASSTDNALVRFDGTTGKLVQNSKITLSDGVINNTLSSSEELIIETPSLVSPGSGKDVTLRAGSGNGASGNGGDLFLSSGAADGVGGTAGNVEISTLSNGGQNSGTINIYSGTTAASGKNSGIVTLQSGEASVSANSGVVTVKSGNAATNTGNVELISGNATNGDSGIVRVKSGTAGSDSGYIEIETGNASTNDSGQIGILTGTAPSGQATGNISLTTGAGQATSGTIALLTGSSDVGSGDVTLTTGDSDNTGIGPLSGHIRIKTGLLTNAGATGSSGEIEIRTGNGNLPTSANSGDIILRTGTATNERGRVTVNARSFKFPVAASDPTGAEAGDAYFNTTSNVLRIYDGATWNTV